MMTTEELIDGASTPNRNGRWVPALPYPAPLIRRFRDAWEVLCGRAEAVREDTAPVAAGEPERTP